MLARHIINTRALSGRAICAIAKPVQSRMYSSMPKFGTDGEKHIYEKLDTELNPTKLNVTDSSGGCGSMYVVEIEAECFRGLNRVKQTKMVNAILKDELKEMHGMRVLCTVPPKDL